MSKIKYTVKTTSQFKKDYKLAMKRNLNISLLKEVVTLLSMGEKLLSKYHLRSKKVCSLICVNSGDTNSLSIPFWM